MNEEEQKGAILTKLEEMAKDLTTVVKKFEELEKWQRNMEVRMALVERNWTVVAAIGGPIVGAALLGIGALLWALLTHQPIVSP